MGGPGRVIAVAFYCVQPAFPKPLAEPGHCNSDGRERDGARNIDRKICGLRIDDGRILRCEIKMERQAQPRRDQSGAPSPHDSSDEYRRN